MTTTAEIDMTAFLNCSDPKVRDDTAALVKKTEEIKQKKARWRAAMAPPGALKLPPHLEAARLAHDIPDVCFTFTQPVYDRILIYQLSQLEGETFTPGGTILMTNEQQDREKNTTPRGVLLSAGLIALDILLSHDIRIGDVVNFVKYTQWRMRVGFFEGENVYCMPLRVHEIYGSEDQVERLRKGETALGFTEGLTGATHHFTGAPTPLNPFQGDEG